MDSIAEIPPLREVVAHAWFTMGYPPARSLVLVEMIPVDGGDVPGFVARIDLPPPRYRRQAAEVLATVARRNEVEAALVLVVRDPVPSGRPLAPDRMKRFVRDLRSVLRRAQVSVLDVVLVDAGRHRSLLCDDATCCPMEGEELGDVGATRTAASMVLRGRALVEDEAALVADVTPDPWPPGVLGADEPGTDPDHLLARWQALVAAWTADGGRVADPSPAEVAWLVPAMKDRNLRDALLVSLLPGGVRIARRFARGQVLGVPDLGAAEARRPDPVLFEAGRALFAAVARGAPAGSRAEALALLGWMSWWQNDAVRARLLAAMAVQDHPGHRLAGLVDTLLLHGVPPSWLVAAGTAPAPRPA
jgi:Domain of unknown function (DUF4192)